MKNEQSLTQQVSTKAHQFLGYFKQATVHRGEKKIYVLEDNAPTELEELIREAHGDFLPDDYRFEMIYDALCAFADCDEDADLEEVQLEAAVYHHSLLQWLSSNLRRVAYCDEAREEFGLTDVDLMTLITYGQQREKDEVVSLVREFLSSLCESEEEDEEESA